MAFTLVMLGTVFLFPMSLATFVLGAVLGFSKAFTLTISIGCWGAAVGAVWVRFVRLGRIWSKPNLATKEFFLFQVAAGGFVLMLSLFFPWAETAPTINLIRGFFSVISVLMNLSYVSLALGIKVSLPAKIFVALAADVAIALLPFLGK